MKSRFLCSVLDVEFKRALPLFVQTNSTLNRARLARNVVGFVVGHVVKPSRGAPQNVFLAQKDAPRSVNDVERRACPKCPVWPVTRFARPAALGRDRMRCFTLWNHLQSDVQRARPLQLFLCVWYDGREGKRVNIDDDSQLLIGRAQTR